MNSSILDTDRPGTLQEGVRDEGVNREHPLTPSLLIPSPPHPSPAASSPQRLRSLRRACWSAALLLGAFDALYAPFSTGRVAQFDDAASYIDIAWAYARGDWWHALNSYWSPLYSWLLALAFRLLHPSAAAEFSVVHLVNLIIFAAALAGFDYLLRAWMEEHPAGDGASGWSGGTCLPPWALLVIAYSLFLWTAIAWIGVQLVSPDLLVAALIYLAAGVTLRLRRSEPRPGAAALLGVILGFGFLAKAVMLPLSGVFLLIAILPVRNPRRAGLSLLVAGLAFLMVTAPFLYGLSRKAGHLTLGDTGRLNYAWFVNGVRQFNWQGEISGHGKAQHPTRIIYPAPAVYEFAGPIGGTYPIWTDPAYWCAGVRARFNWHQQAHALLKNLTVGRSQIPWAGPGGLVVAGLMLLLTIVLAAKRRLPAGIRWDLLLLSVAPAVLYTLVVVESRYLGASVVLLGLAVLPAIRLPANQRGRAMVVPITLLILLIPALGVARAGTRDIARKRASRADWDAAVGLRALGIHAGDRVGCIGLSCDNAWALLARVSVVAEVPTHHEADYWGASPRVRAAVLRAFAKAGVRAVMTGPPPVGAESGWQRLGTTDRYVRLLHPAS